MVKENDTDYPEVVVKVQIFSELIEYLESLMGCKSVLCMGEIYHLYLSRLTSISVTEAKIHHICFRQHILAAILDMTAKKIN